MKSEHWSSRLSVGLLALTANTGVSAASRPVVSSGGIEEIVVTPAHTGRVFQLSARSAQKASPRFWCAPGVRLPKKGPRKVKMGHQQIAGVLWKSVVLCCAFPCSRVDLQRTSREQG